MLAGILALLTVAIGGGVGLYLASNRPISTSKLMSLSAVPNRAAPNFTLINQYGKTLSLSSFRGKPLAIYFMDPRCQDVCPIVAQELVDADRYLGAEAAKVELVGIDVNPNYTARRWLDSFDSEHGLNHLSNWQFFTGSLAQLRSVWQKYSISVQTDPRTGDVLHTTVIYFVGSHGHERALAGPWVHEHKNGTGYLASGLIRQWGRGIATQLAALL